LVARETVTVDRWEGTMATARAVARKAAAVIMAVVLMVARKAAAVTRAVVSTVAMVVEEMEEDTMARHQSMPLGTNARDVRYVRFL
jgi:hypothetical protein